MQYQPMDIIAHHFETENARFDFSIMKLMETGMQ